MSRNIFSMFKPRFGLPQKRSSIFGLPDIFFPGSEKLPGPKTKDIPFPEKKLPDELPNIPILPKSIDEIGNLGLSDKDLLEAELAIIGILLSGGLKGSAVGGLLAEEGLGGNAQELLRQAKLSQEAFKELSTSFEQSKKKIQDLKDAVGNVSKNQDILHEEETLIESEIQDIKQEEEENFEATQKSINDLKLFINENQGHINAVRHQGDVIIQDELKALEKEGKEEVDALVRIATTLDKPEDINDFFIDLSKFENPKSKIDYVVENFSQFNSLDNLEKSEILEELLNIGGLEVIRV